MLSDYPLQYTINITISRVYVIIYKLGKNVMISSLRDDKCKHIIIMSPDVLSMYIIHPSQTTIILTKLL